VKEDLWKDGWTITKVVEQLLSWGDGSGEELYDWLREGGLGKNGSLVVFTALKVALMENVDKEAKEYRKATGRDE